MRLRKMGFSDLRKGLCILALFSFVCAVKANVTVNGSVFIYGSSPIAKTDENFICATMDWWPPEKYDYGTCSWSMASLLNLDLKSTVFLNAIKVQSDGLATGPWGSSNAASLIRHTIKKGYNIYGWELGIELCGGGIGARIPADSYANDTIVLDDLYETFMRERKSSPTPYLQEDSLNLTGLNNFLIRQ